MQERVQITVLSQLGSTTSGNLEELYFSSDPRQRELCFTFLGELALIKPDTRMIILKLLMKGVIDADIQNRATAIYYLGEISRHSPRLAQHVIYPLVMILLKSDEKQIIQFQALIALEKLNKQSMSIQKFLYKGISDVAYLTVAKLDSGDPTERKEATWKIGKLGMIFFPAILDLVNMILNLLVDEHDGVKSMAKKTICDLIPS
ncbi:hypothetical protein GF325_19140, partial [Candidatus Bathyarchaeota archaeon]|nr:hypothetical protein [Candidatus Bathyarchaeota archaeon]